MDIVLHGKVNRGALSTRYRRQSMKTIFGIKWEEAKVRYNSTVNRNRKVGESTRDIPPTFYPTKPNDIASNNNTDLGSS